MTQDSNPLFPRVPDDEEKDRLIRETRNRLASEEAGFAAGGADVCPNCGQTNRPGVKYCRRCGDPFDPNERELITTLYGPPPLPFDEAPPPDFPPSEVYGPPPLPLRNENPPFPPVYGPPPLPIPIDGPKSRLRLWLLLLAGGLLLLGAAALVLIYIFLPR